MITVGAQVRILPPFNAGWPDTYTVLAVSADGVVLDLPGYADGAGFALEYVELA